MQRINNRSGDGTEWRRAGVACRVRVHDGPMLHCAPDGRPAFDPITVEHPSGKFARLLKSPNLQSFSRMGAATLGLEKARWPSLAAALRQNARFVDIAPPRAIDPVRRARTRGPSGVLVNARSCGYLGRLLTCL
jgi:hypothetical protein